MEDLDIEINLSDYGLTDWTNKDNCDIPEDNMVFTPTQSGIAGGYAIFASLSGFALNLTFIVAILNYGRTKNHVTTPFLVSVSVADLLTCSFNLPILATRFITRDWMGNLGPELCRIYPLFFYGVLGASLFSLTMVTVQRAMLLLIPEKANSIFSKVVYIGQQQYRIYSLIVLSFSWLFPTFLVSLPTLNIYGGVGLNLISQSCTMVQRDGKNMKSFSYLVGFIIPCTTLLLVNIRMAVKIWRMKRKSIYGGDEQRQDARFIVMLGMVFLSFFLCYFPALIVKGLDKCYVHSNWHIASYMIHWTNVILNPLVYFYMNERYKIALTTLLEDVFKIKGGGEQERTVGIQFIPSVRIKPDLSSTDNL